MAATRPVPTIKSIAEELGVSRMTVSFGLNGTGNISEEMRRKVVETATRLDYKVNPDALSLKGQRPLAIGVFALWFDVGVGANKLRMIQSLLKERGYEAPLHGVGLSEIFDARGQAGAVAALCRDKPRVLVATMNGLQHEAITAMTVADLSSDSCAAMRDGNAYPTLAKPARATNVRVGRKNAGEWNF